jgi:hypothetical protein
MKIVKNIGTDKKVCSTTKTFHLNLEAHCTLDVKNIREKKKPR